MNNSLDKEFQTFRENLNDLSKEHLGKFVLIKGDEIIGIFEDEIDAIKKGVEKFEDSPFLVNEITDSGFKINFLPRLVRV